VDRPLSHRLDRLELPLHPVAPVLTFLGAAGTVTGSRFLVDTPQARVLVDCGLYQGRKELRLRNREPFPVPVETIDAVVLTHAHVDHVGYLPALWAAGYRGPVHATAGTTQLAGIVLPDAGHLQEEEADYANSRGFSKHSPALPLYTEADATATLALFSPVAFHAEIEVAKGVFATFRPAGHILGSATVALRLHAASDRVVLFSGDLGRPHHPLLVPPSPPGRPDVVVMESTYGDRRHDDEGTLERFADAICRTARRGGMVLIPAFAVDRTEVVLVMLRRLLEGGHIPELPLYVDSPMALRALRVYRRAIAEGAEDVDSELRGDGDPFGATGVTEVVDVAGSKALAGLNVPSIIISASGMATGGRVVHHLAHLLPDRRNTVMLVGYQAPGTRGRALAEGAREVKMLGRYVPARAEVVDLGAFSVHADRSELAVWLDSAEAEPDVVYLVHGEPESSAALGDDLRAGRPRHVVVPELGERVRLDAPTTP
jgi:metallo-beta-lactamase family protein